MKRAGAFRCTPVWASTAWSTRSGGLHAMSPCHNPRPAPRPLPRRRRGPVDVGRVPLVPLREAHQPGADRPGPRRRLPPPRHVPAPATKEHKKDYRVLATTLRHQSLTYHCTRAHARANARANARARARTHTHAISFEAYPTTPGAGPACHLALRHRAGHIGRGSHSVGLGDRRDPTQPSGPAR